MLGLARSNCFVLLLLSPHTTESLHPSEKAFAVFERLQPYYWDQIIAHFVKNACMKTAQLYPEYAFHSEFTKVRKTLKKLQKLERIKVESHNCTERWIFYYNFVCYICISLSFVIYGESFTIQSDKDALLHTFKNVTNINKSNKILYTKLTF
jgi:hypothetical protein